MKKFNVFRKSNFKSCLLVIIFILGLNPFIFSQNLDISTEENENMESEIVKERLRNYRADIDNRNVKLARINGFKKLFQREKFNLKIPNYTSVFEVEKRRLMFEAEDSWTYFGTIYNKKNDLTGELSITNYFGEIYGEIIVDNQLYTIDNADLKENGNSKLYFVEKNMDILSEDYCGVTQSEREIFDKDEIAKMRSMPCSGTTVNVGFVYTEAARLSTNCPARAMNSIQALNDALLNSDIAENELEFRVRTIVRFNSFNENNYATDGTLLNTVSNDQFVENVRNYTNSDIIVVLTNRVASNVGTIGRSSLATNGNSELGFACWAEADHSNTIIEHEIGHLFGCKHQNDIASQPNIPFWARANNVTGARTIMTDIVTNVDINNFSNPDVFVNSGFVPTGASDRNNAQRLKDQGLTVAAYRTGSSDVNIYGPSCLYINNPVDATWCASSCVSISSYLWEWSYNGWWYLYLDNTPCLSKPSNFFGSNVGQPFYIRLTVTFNNGTTTTKHLTVTRKGGTGSLTDGESQLLKIGQDKMKSTYTEIIRLYPNPVRDILYIESDNENSGRIEILNQEGRLLKVIDTSKQNHSNSTLSIDLIDISPGMYFVKQYSNDMKGYKFGKFVKTQ